MMYKAIYKAAQCVITVLLQVSLLRYRISHVRLLWYIMPQKVVRIQLWKIWKCTDFIFSIPARIAFVLRAVLDSCTSLQQVGGVFTQQSDSDEYPINPDPNKQLHCA